MGATVQAERADAAQQRVNEVVRRAIDAIRRLGIEQEDMQTSALSLQPVYANEAPDPQRSYEPRVIGYRASNTLRIDVDRLERIGPVIDAAVEAGANQVEGIFFEVEDDAPARRQAIARAVEDGRAKAESMAQAIGVRLGDLLEATESAFFPAPEPRYQMARMEMADASTPIEPGMLQVQATVTLRYAVAR